MVRQYEYSVAVLLVTFCELSGVPFLICACSQECQKAIAKKYGDLNIELQKQLDLEYERMVKEANAFAKHGDVDITSLNVPGIQISTAGPRWANGYGSSYTHLHMHTQQHGRRRHRKKCSIM
jgi:hypothetical protein